MPMPAVIDTVSFRMSCLHWSWQALGFNLSMNRKDGVSETDPQYVIAVFQLT